MIRHYCNGVVDIATCCPVAHGAEDTDENCTCSNWWKVAYGIPGVSREDYLTEMAKYTHRSSEPGYWEKANELFDRYSAQLKLFSN